MDTKKFITKLFATDPGIKGEIPADAIYTKGHCSTIGFRHAPETKKFMSESMKKFYEDHPERRILSKNASQRKIRVSIDKKEAQKLYNNGMSMNQLAKHYDCSLWRIQCLKLKVRSKSVAIKMVWDDRKAA